MLKKLLKILLWTIGVVVILLLVTLVAIRILFPTTKIKKLLIAEIEASLNRRATLGSLRFNPFRGFTLDDMVIYDRPPADSSGNYFFRCGQVHLHYRISSLFKKKIEIHNILIDSPEIYLSQNADLRWNFDDLLVVDSTAVDTAAAELSLPLTVLLQQFQLNNLTAYISIAQMDTLYTLRTGGIYGRIDDLFLPRKTYADLKKGARAKLTIYSDDRPWQLGADIKSTVSHIDVRSILNLKIETQIDGLEKIKAEGELSLNDLEIRSSERDSASAQTLRFPLSPVLQLALALTANAETGDLFIKKMTTYLAGEPILDIKGNIADFLDQPQFDLLVVNSEANLANWLKLLMPLLPDTLRNEYSSLGVTGTVSLRGTEIRGNPLSSTPEEGLVFHVALSLADCSLGDSILQTFLSRGSGSISLSGVYLADGLQPTSLQSTLSFDSFTAAVDTLEYVFQDIHFDMQGLLNAEFLPTWLKGKLRIEQFFDVPLIFDFDFASAGDLNQYKAHGLLTCSQMPLRQVSEDMVDGRVDVVIALVSQSLDRILADVKMQSSSLLLYPTDPEPIGLNPLVLAGNLVLSTDPTFEKIVLKPSPITLNDFGTGLLRGDFTLLPQQQLRLFLEPFRIAHPPFWAYLPDSLMEGLESLRFLGETLLNAEMIVDIPDVGDVIMDIRGTGDVLGSIEYPDVSLTVKSIAAQAHFQTDGLAGSFDGQIQLDSLLLGGVLEQPLRHITSSIQGHFPDVETIHLDTATVIIPDLATAISVTGVIDSLSGNTRVKLDSYLVLDAARESVQLEKLLQLSGKIVQRMHLALHGDLAEIRGDIAFQNVHLTASELAKVEAIDGRIPFSETINIATATIVSENQQPSFLAASGTYHYDVLRPYYYQQHNRFSSLSIGKIEAAGYFATDIKLDMLISNERVEVPRFSLKLYDGNLSGFLFVNLHDGTPELVDWRIKANLASMNSAKLLPAMKLRTKGSELNMNLELAGTGLDPATKFEVGGYLYVTQIGPQFMDNALQSLDPKGTDKSIQSTRRLLRWGYKPRLVSIEIKHDNLYPTIHLSKASFLTKIIPLDLSGNKIELARIPIKILLTSTKTP
ncbi:MAG: AsmA family protein [candidate division KSB1 bacterium]|nr:AsmA family protein [candidate division KSB1 bacterium]